MKHIGPFFLFLFIILWVYLVSVFCGILRIQSYKTPEVFNLGKHNKVVQEAGLTCTSNVSRGALWICRSKSGAREAKFGRNIKKARVFRQLSALGKKTRRVEGVFPKRLSWKALPEKLCTCAQYRTNYSFWVIPWNRSFKVFLNDCVLQPKLKLTLRLLATFHITLS